MRILIAIIMIFCACLVLLIALLSVLRDLLVITTRDTQSELNSRAIDCEGAALRDKMSDDVQRSIVSTTGRDIQRRIATQ